MRMIADCLHGIFFAIGGLCFALVAAGLTVLMFAGSDFATIDAFIVYVYLFWLLALVICLRAQSVAAAWSQVFSGLGLMIFLLPIVLMVKIQAKSDGAAIDVSNMDPLSLVAD